MKSYSNDLPNTSPEEVEQMRDISQRTLTTTDNLLHLVLTHQKENRKSLLILTVFTLISIACSVAVLITVSQ